MSGWRLVTLLEIVVASLFIVGSVAGVVLGVIAFVVLAVMVLAYALHVELGSWEE